MQDKARTMNSHLGIPIPPPLLWVAASPSAAQIFSRPSSGSAGAFSNTKQTFASGPRGAGQYDRPGRLGHSDKSIGFTEQHSCRAAAVYAEPLEEKRD